ncbi:MAG: cation transporter, partial [Pseudomonas sp.]
MAGNCCNSGCASAAVRGRYRRILWIALLINLA